MKPNELRIGNLFWGAEMVQTVKEMHKYGDQLGYEYLIMCEENGNQYKPIEMQGIPLTEEWLKKFGFEKDGRYYIRGEHNDRFSGLIKIYRESFLEGDWILNIGKIEWITSFKYVHELQNVIFALTGKEL